MLNSLYSMRGVIPTGIPHFGMQWRGLILPNAKPVVQYPFNKKAALLFTAVPPGFG